MEMRALGGTGIQVSPVGLGTVKFGRNEQVKYPQPFQLPDDDRVRDLLWRARDLGINLLDTAPAYGSSQERLGRLLPGPREHWIIVSKVGEFFENGKSRFDFSAEATRRTVESSLRILRTDYLDVVLVHSNGDDIGILDHGEAIDTLQELKRQGLIRAFGMSSKTVDGGLRTVQACDLVMATYNPAQTEELPVIRAARLANKGVLIKKALQSGHIRGIEAVSQAMQFILTEPGVSSVIVGTLNPAHLRSNVEAAEAAIKGGQ